MNWLRNFMTGRYGGDQLSIATLVLYLILSVINMFAASPIVLALSYVLVFVWAFRFFSRNIYKRQAENRKFLQLMQPFSAMITLWKRRFTERDSRFFRCPKCHQIIRVPKGKGRIAIRCPKCRDEFIKRT